MTKDKLTSKTQDELTKLLQEKRESLRTMRFDASGAKVVKPHEYRRLRREIARILTELTQRQLSNNA